MVARRPSEFEIIDELLLATKQLLRRLEEVKAAEAHGERDHGRPRPRSASSNRTIFKLKLAAVYNAIVKEAEAQLAKLGEPEAHKQETHEQEASALPSQGHVADQILTERRLSERRTRGSNLRFPCPLSQLRKNMVATINRRERHYVTTMSTSADISFYKCRSTGMLRNSRDSYPAPRHWTGTRSKALHLLKETPTGYMRR
jgi:hypothetical protein